MSSDSDEPYGDDSSCSSSDSVEEDDKRGMWDYEADNSDDEDREMFQHEHPEDEPQDLMRLYGFSED